MAKMVLVEVWMVNLAFMVVMLFIMINLVKMVLVNENQ
jgi:hypothetical protein